MPDLLVNLLKLPSPDSAMVQMEKAGILIRRAHPFEITLVRSFVEEHFSVAWADEISVGFANKPVSIYIAVLEKQIVGFSAYECTRKTLFGPTGVAEEMQGRGIGTALLIVSLWGLKELGYVYGIIGGAGPIEFYEKAVGAIVIPGSDPGIYANLLK
ncbi:MAG: GNAT family N-acetyltransferase [Pyrinomonadaceae bacterium]|nr:GNAT family N-acetyltransferase [Pyrinomonadaceae bacterium]MDQ3173241.1 GNAT family N-acetyltransferase [Acidobacteriota bacterium]